MIRRLLMWLGVKPVRLIAVSVKRCDEHHDVKLLFQLRSWATEEDLAVERARVLTAIRRKLNGADNGKIINGEHEYL